MKIFREQKLDLYQRKGNSSFSEENKFVSFEFFWMSLDCNWFSGETNYQWIFTWNIGSLFCFGMEEVTNEQIKEALRLRTSMTLQKAFESCEKFETTKQFANKDADVKCVYSVR